MIRSMTCGKYIGPTLQSSLVRRKHRRVQDGEAILEGTSETKLHPDHRVPLASPRAKFYGF